MPSEVDDKLTERMKYAGQLMCVKMLDHIIIGADGSFYSYARANVSASKRANKRKFILLAQNRKIAARSQGGWSIFIFIA